jgi:PHD finger-like domain-containing protein 5A
MMLIVFRRQYFCRLWTQQRDGCPKIVNLGSARTDLFYEKKKYGYRGAPI